MNIGHILLTITFISQFQMKNANSLSISMILTKHFMVCWGLNFNYIYYLHFCFKSSKHYELLTFTMISPKCWDALSMCLNPKAFFNLFPLSCFCFDLEPNFNVKTFFGYVFYNNNNVFFLIRCMNLIMKLILQKICPNGLMLVKKWTYQI